MNIKQQYNLMYTALEKIASDIGDCEKCASVGDMDNYNGHEKTLLAIETLKKISKTG